MAKSKYIQLDMFNPIQVKPMDINECTARKLNNPINAIKRLLRFDKTDINWEYIFEQEWWEPWYPSYNWYQYSHKKHI